LNNPQRKTVANRFVAMDNPHLNVALAALKQQRF
jgi:hypothetical protein